MRGILYSERNLTRNQFSSVFIFFCVWFFIFLLLLFICFFHHHHHQQLPERRCFYYVFFFTALWCVYLFIHLFCFFFILASELPKYHMLLLCRKLNASPANGIYHYNIPSNNTPGNFLMRLHFGKL